MIENLERRIARQFEKAHCALVGSGTTALYVSFRAAGLPKGASVLYPDFTCETAVNAAVFADLTPEFCDIDLDQFNMSAAAARKACDETQFAAVVPTHIFGHRMDVAEIAEIVGSGVTIIEDSAQSYGSILDGNLMSGEANASIISLGDGKLLSCAGGGAILSDDSKFIAECRRISESLLSDIEEQASERKAVMTGFVAARRQADANTPIHALKAELFRRHKNGYLSKLNDVQARSISAELDRAEQIVARRIKETLRLDQVFASIDTLQLPKKTGDETPWRYCFLAPEKDRDALFESLASDGIPVSKYFEPCHRAYGLADSAFPNTCSIASRIINIKYPPLVEGFERLYDSLVRVLDRWRAN